MVSENVPTTDRRTRKREERRSRLLDLAADLVESDGVDGVTNYAPASLYTYFPSRSALLAALQQRALATLADVGASSLDAWRNQLTGDDAHLDALTLLWAFSDLFVAAPRRHPREFRLQQQLLVTPGAEDVGDAAAVVPAAMTVLDLPRRLLAEAAAAGALDPAQPADDPVGAPIDGDLLRTFAWVVALNGALMIDGLATGAPSTGAALGSELTDTLLRGWGADPDRCRSARGRAAALDRAALDRAALENTALDRAALEGPHDQGEVPR